MIVRPAQREDLLDIGRVAEAAHWVSYEGLLRPDTIGQLISRDFGPASLARRLLRGGLSVVSLGADVIAFADAETVDGALHVGMIAVLPPQRRRGAGSALLRTFDQGALHLPLRADVLVGNLEGESFYEANGFVPGETITSEIFAEEIVEQRWWREPEANLDAVGPAARGR